MFTAVTPPAATVGAEYSYTFTASGNPAPTFAVAGGDTLPLGLVLDATTLAARIRVLQDLAQGGDRAYGVPRITANLNDGVPAVGRVNHKRESGITKPTPCPRSRVKASVRLGSHNACGVPSGRRAPE